MRVVTGRLGLWSLRAALAADEDPTGSHRFRIAPLVDRLADRPRIRLGLWDDRGGGRIAPEGAGATLVPEEFVDPVEGSRALKGARRMAAPGQRVSAQEFQQEAIRRDDDVQNSTAVSRRG